MAEVARRLRAHGTVQDVFFRHSTVTEAQRVGVRGWVANRDDGSVEAVVEGPPEAVDSLVAFCRAGPGRAVVTRLEVDDEPVRGLGTFEQR